LKTESDRPTGDGPTTHRPTSHL